MRHLILSPQRQQFTSDTRPSTSESPTTGKTIYSAKRINITSQNKRSISAVHAQKRLLQVGVIATASAEKRPSFTIPLIHMHFDGFVQKMLAKVANDSLPIAEVSFYIEFVLFLQKFARELQFIVIKGR